MYILLIIIGATLNMDNGFATMHADQHPAYPDIQSCIVAKMNVLRTEPKQHHVLCVKVTDVTDGKSKPIAS